jgi:hypothetical protein
MVPHLRVAVQDTQETKVRSLHLCQRCLGGPVTGRPAGAVRPGRVATDSVAALGAITAGGDRRRKVTAAVTWPKPSRRHCTTAPCTPGPPHPRRAPQIPEIAATWPWAQEFTTAGHRIQAIPHPT